MVTGLEFSGWSRRLDVPPKQGRWDYPSDPSAYAMPDAITRPPEFWDAVAEHVTAKVEPVRHQREHARTPVIAYLHDLEAAARRECDSREVIQIIASGRRVLGDRSAVVGPERGPFCRT